MYPALAATLAALTATGVGDVPGGWAPVDSDGVHRHAALGLFDLQALKPAQAQATKSSRNPLFGQDKAWETRIDNGCEAAPAPACTSTIPSRYPKVSPGSFGEQSSSYYNALPVREYFGLRPWQRQGSSPSPRPPSWCTVLELAIVSDLIHLPCGRVAVWPWNLDFGRVAMWPSSRLAAAACGWPPVI